MIRHARAALRLSLFTAPIALFACSPPPPPPPPKVEPPPAKPEPPPAPPLSAAHWVENSGATLVGPTTDSGTIVLLSGRRLLIGKDGTTKGETARAPEPLLGITEIPTAAGKKLVAHSSHAVYRLDDPLGEPKVLARAQAEIWRIGPGPGAVAIWDLDSDIPRFVDVDSGQLKQLPNMPVVPANAIAFRDLKEGAAVFEAAGLSVTTDGGATWKPVTAAVTGDALRVMDLFLNGDKIAGSFGYGLSRLAIDPAAGTLGEPEQPEPPSNEAPLITWLRKTEKDPLTEVAFGGVMLNNGEAVIASAGFVARVDPKSGAILELKQIGREEATTCWVTKGSDVAWVGCALDASDSDDDYEPFGLFRLPLSATSLSLGKPEKRRQGEIELRTSPGGGVLFFGSCDVDSGDMVCVRGTDGKWQGMSPEIDLYDRGVGALADGRIVFMRGLYDGEPPPADQTTSRGGGPGPGPQLDEEEGEAPSGPRRSYLVALDANGKEKTLVTIEWPEGTSDLMMRSSIQEDESGALHVAVSSDESVYVIVASPSKVPVNPEKSLAGGPGTYVRLAGRMGVLVTPSDIQSTTDGGVSWSPIQAPKSLARDLAEGNLYLDDSAAFSVSDGGMRIDRYMRVGWGAQEPLPDERELSGGVALSRPATPAPVGPERVLKCTTDGAGQGLAPVSYSYQLTDFFVKSPAAKGTRRKTSYSAGSRFGLLDTQALLALEGPDKPGSTPAKWNLSYFDPSEVGGKIRTLSATAPKDMATWEISLRSAYSAGNRVMFSIRNDSTRKNYLVRPKSGGLDFAEVGYDIMPGGDVVFGSEKGEPIAWSVGGVIVVWMAGEKPRVIGTMSGRSLRALGNPTKDGIPVLLTSTSWSLAKVLPIPMADTKKDKNAVAAQHPQSVWLDGWTPVVHFRRELGHLPACGKQPKGQVLRLSRYSGFWNVDGVDETGQSATYELRINGNEACVSNISAFVANYGRPPPPAAGAKPPKPGAPVPGPVAFLRYDVLGNKAEGGDRGLPRTQPKGVTTPLPPMVRKLSCKLEDKK